VVSYVINTVAYTKTGETLLAGVSAFGAVLVLCKYLEFNIVFPSELEQAEMNQLKLLHTYLLTPWSRVILESYYTHMEYPQLISGQQQFLLCCSESPASLPTANLLLFNAFANKSTQ
jgi:hypothetical protein